MNAHEIKALKLVAEWIRVRDFIKAQLGTDYPEALRRAETMLAHEQARTGQDRIHAAMALLQRYDDAVQPITGGLFVALLVEDELPPIVPAEAHA